MKRVNGSQPVPRKARSTCLQTHQKGKDCEAVRSAPLKRHIFPFLHWTRTPWCNLPLLSLPILWISLSGAVCPKFFSIKTRWNLNQQQQQKFDIFFDFCAPNSRGEGGERGKKRTLELNTPMKKLQHQNTIPLFMFFLESSSVPSGCGPAANTCFRRSETFK